LRATGKDVLESAGIDSWEETFQPGDEMMGLLIANFDQRQMIFKSNDAYAGVSCDDGAVIRFCAPQLSAHYDRAFGIQLDIDVCDFAEQLDLAGAGFLVAIQRYN
jgi:hypothetical protein